MPHLYVIGGSLRRHIYKQNGIFRVAKGLEHRLDGRRFSCAHRTYYEYRKTVRQKGTYDVIVAYRVHSGNYYLVER